jgi:hypothetical protein
MVTTGRIDNGPDNVRTACSVRGAGMPFSLIGKPLIMCARPYGAMAQWQALILFWPYQRVFSLRPLS